MSWQSVVEILDEVVTIIVRQRHKCAAHHDELDLVDGMTQLSQLSDAASGLQVGIVPEENDCSDLNLENEYSNHFLIFKKASIFQI